MRELKARRMQRRAPGLFDPASILSIAQKDVARVFRLRTDLVRTPGLQFQFDERDFLISKTALVLWRKRKHGLLFPGASVGFRKRRDEIGFFIFDQPVLPASRPRDPAFDPGEVPTINFPGLERGRQSIGCFGARRNYHQARGVSVPAVDESDVWAAPTEAEPIHDIRALRAPTLRQKSGRFVEDDQVRVLVKNQRI